MSADTSHRHEIRALVAEGFLWGAQTVMIWLTAQSDIFQPINQTLDEYVIPHQGRTNIQYAGFNLSFLSVSDVHQMRLWLPVIWAALNFTVVVMIKTHLQKAPLL